MSKKILIALGFIAFVVLMLAVAPAVFMLIWPRVIPGVFPVLVENGMISSEITFWQSFGIIIMSAILFKSFSTSSKKGGKE